jgi:hypothetical protein
MRNNVRSVFVIITSLAWVLIFLTTRGEASCLHKLERTRGSVRSVQIAPCEVKKCNAQNSPVFDLSREIVMLWHFSGFLPFPREAIGHPLGTNLSLEFVLLL